MKTKKNNMEKQYIVEEKYIVEFLKEIKYIYIKIENEETIKLIYQFLISKFEDSENRGNIEIKCDYYDSYYYIYIGIYFYAMREWNEMIKYYLMAVELKNSYAMIMLGNYYHRRKKEYNKAIEYYLMAIELQNSYAMTNLAYYYENVKEYDKMMEYYLMAIELKNPFAMINLGSYYEKIKEYDKMMEYYSMSIEFSEFGDLCIINKIKNLFKNTKFGYNKILQCIIKNKDSEIIQTHFKKFLQFYSSRKNQIELGECIICCENNEIIPFDCLCHKQCISCYIKIEKCDSCDVPKNDYYKKLFD